MCRLSITSLSPSKCANGNRRQARLRPLPICNQISALRASFPLEALSADTSRGFELTSIKAAFVVERLNTEKLDRAQVSALAKQVIDGKLSWQEAQNRLDDWIDAATLPTFGAANGRAEAEKVPVVVSAKPMAEGERSAGRAVRLTNGVRNFRSRLCPGGRCDGASCRTRVRVPGRGNSVVKPISMSSA